MHIKKNIYDNVIGTLMNIDEKTKDSLSACQDIQKMGIRHSLYLKEENRKTILPIACFSLSKKERKELCHWLSNLKFPDNYAINLS